MIKFEYSNDSIERFNFIYKYLLLIAVASIFIGKISEVTFLGRDIFLNAADIVIPLCFIFVLLIVLLSGGKIATDKGLIIYLIFIIYIFLSSFWAVDQLKVFRGGLTFINALFIYFIVINAVKKEEDIEFYVEILKKIGLIISLIIISIFIHNYELIHYGFYQYKKEIAIPLGKSNYLASFLSFFLFTTFSFYDKKKLMNILIIILILLGIMLTGSRGALVSIFAGFLFFTARYKKYVLWLGFLLIFIFLIQMYSNVLNIRLFREMLHVNALTPISRLIMMNAGWEVFKLNPILGVGLHNIRVILPQNYFLPGTEIHNGLIQMLSEAGLIGTFLYSAIYIYCIKLWRSLNYFFKEKYFGFFIGIMVMVIHSNFEIIFLTPSYEYLLALFLGFLFVIVSSDENKNQSSVL